jgi:DNA polymerase-3 subunit epsilon
VAPPAPRLTELLESFSFGDALDEGAPEGSAAYLELLAAALEDGELSDSEQAALADAAAVYELNAEQIHSANKSFLLALAHIAFDDGVISRSERAELNTTADLLGLKRTLLTEVLEHAEAARHERMSQGLRPLPKVWSLGEPLRVGDKVVFTGCDDALRDRLERRAEKLGVRVLGAVSRRVAMLVTDGGFDGTKAAAARELGTRVVSPEDFAVLLKHLQPALPRRHGIAQVTSTTEAAAPAEPQSSPVTSLGDPRAIRDWARQNGFEVGIRGRLPSHVLDAYRSRDTASSN